jgi:hypothetical protein
MYICCRSMSHAGRLEYRLAPKTCSVVATKSGTMITCDMRNWSHTLGSEGTATLSPPCPQRYRAVLLNVRTRLRGRCATMRSWRKGATARLAGANLKRSRNPCSLLSLPVHCPLRSFVINVDQRRGARELCVVA